MNKQCNIFGVQNQSEPDPLIKKALNSSIKLLDIFKFIEITNFADQSNNDKLVLANYG